MPTNCSGAAVGAARSPRAYAPQTTSKTNKIVLAIGAVAAVAVLIALSLVGNNAQDKEDRLPNGRSSSAGSGPDAAEPSVAPAGSPVRDGKFEFRIINFYSTKTVSDPTNNPYMRETAQGVFAVVTLSVTNIGNEPQNYFGSNQKLIDTAGRSYEVSSAADMYMNTDVGIMGQINPGNSIQVKLPFDVPPDSRFTMLELHDSMLSGASTRRIPPDSWRSRAPSFARTVTQDSPTANLS